MIYIPAILIVIFGLILEYFLVQPMASCFDKGKKRIPIRKNLLRIILAILLLVLIIFLLIHFFPSSSGEQAQITATPNDQQITTTATSAITPGQFVSVNTPLPIINIGVYIMDNYYCGLKIENNIPDRLASLGFHVEFLNGNGIIDYSVLKNYNVIYFPAGWGAEAAFLAPSRHQLLEFLKTGGGVIVEKPNQNQVYRDSYLPYTITFKPGKNNPNDWPPLLINDHYLINGLSSSEYPEAGNSIIDWAPEYIVLTQTEFNHYPTLLVSQYESGRIVITTSTACGLDATQYHFHVMGDELIRRMIYWVAGQEP